MDINDKAIRIVNRQAIRLAKIRAAKENRSAANAIVVTIIEALGDKYGQAEPSPRADFRRDIIEKSDECQG